ncbi:MAG: ABC transporter permease [bacterium]
MKLVRNLKLSRKALAAHKLRTILALVGITIGVAAVILMVAIGEGAQREVVRRIEQMGANLLVVNAGKVKKVVGRQQRSGNVETLLLEDYEAILTECPSVRLATPVQDRGRPIKFDNYSTVANVLGATPDFAEIRNFPVVAGRYFSDAENKATRRVAVIGYRVIENLFDGEYPVGEIIRISNIPFEVIGVLKEKGVSPDGADEDNVVVIPIATALRRVFNLNHLDKIFVQATSTNVMERATVEIRELLRERHRLNKRSKTDDFTIQNQIDALNAQRQTSDMFTLLITSIAGLSLFVGGVGILAIMLLSVKERTNEIGLRMATGARPKDVLTQFLAEALVLGLFGGLFGVICGVLGAAIVGKSTAWHTAISPESILISLLFSFAIGLFFGVYPARKASLLDPIEALRAE